MVVRGGGDAGPRNVETRGERRECGGRTQVDRSERDETVHFKFSLSKEEKRSDGRPACLPLQLNLAAS